jgi:FkbH-like protein
MENSLLRRERVMNVDLGKERARQEKKATDEWRRERKVKCLVWDLDNTLWKGILLEDNSVSLREDVIHVIQTLDERGILQSIASRNDYAEAMSKLKDLGLDEYFIYPQINWGSKSISLDIIARSINVGMDALAFIDDQKFERDEVAHVHPDVLVIDAVDINGVLAIPEMMPRFVTSDSRQRRKMYLADFERKQVEERFEGAQEDFLRSLKMSLYIGPAKESDLKRAEELTVRTNQLNTTGRTYSYDELDGFRKSDCHHLWVADLKDKYGEYGKIGLAFIEIIESQWWIRLLLMSCRVMNRGMGAVFINHIRNEARENNVRLFAELIPNNRNRMMYMTYKFSHFKEVEQNDGITIFENDLSVEQPFPDYLTISMNT